MDDMILVTGGAGFIGSHLVDALLSDGSDVRVLDDFSSGKEKNLDASWRLAAAYGGRLQVIEGDVRDEYKMRDCVDGCAAVVHLAAIASVQRSFDDPVGCGSVTHGGTVNAVRQAVEAEVPRIVLASSCAVYGDSAEPPITETSPPRPLSPYAVAKLASEEACAEAANAGQIAAACLRFFNVYGPRQDPSSVYSGVISRFMAAAAESRPISIYGTGGQSRDFVYVGDVVGALQSALTRPLSGVSVLNVGSGTETSVLDVANEVEAQAGVTLERRLEPAREGDIARSCASTGRSRWVLGWEATIGLAEGLAATWEWYREAAGSTVAAGVRRPRA